MEEKKLVQPVEIPVMHCFDNNYVIPAAVSFYSMLENADPQYNYRLFVLHSDITVQNQQKLTKLVRGFKNADLEFIEMNNQLDDIWNNLANTDHLSREMLYKLIAPEIFPQYDQLIITDVDVVFLGDISPSIRVFDNNQDAYFAGVHHINPDKTFLRSYYENYRTVFSAIEYEQLKICAGYLVLNVKKLREDKMSTVFIDYLEKNAERLLQPEQDTINFCCRSKQISMLPLNYVVCSYMYDICTTPDVTASDPYYTYQEMADAMQHPIQLHYATKTKPWNTPDSTKAEIWYDYLEKTGFFEEFTIKNLYASAKPQPLPCCQLFPNTTEEAPVKVSILVCSYNHERFIKHTLQSIIDQKTNYSYEIIVADDASTDRTQQIIREFKKKHPDIMKKTILRTKNVGIGSNYYEALCLAEGEYLAICDGDDYWVDDEKLEKQISFLEANKEYTVACADFRIHEVGKPDDEDTEYNITKYLRGSCGIKKKYTIHDLVFSRFIASCTMVLRWKLKNRVPEFLKEYRVIDFPLSLIHASCGFIKVFPEVMSVYNVHPKSISNSAHATVLNDSIRLMAELNQFLGYRITALYNEYMNSLKPVPVPATTPASQVTESVQDTTSLTAVLAPVSPPTMYQRLERLYANCMPEIGKQAYRAVKKGIKFCYRELVPQGIRVKIARRRNKI